MKTIKYKHEPSTITKIANSDVDFTKFPVLGLTFDTDKNLLIIDGNGKTKTLKVECDSEYTYNIMKTKIKASGGIEGLYKMIEDASKPDALFHGRMYKALASVILK